MARVRAEATAQPRRLVRLINTNGLPGSRYTIDPTMANQLSNSMALKDLRILIVEDMGLIAVELQRMIEEFGCTAIGPAARVDEATDIAKNEQLDGVLLDLQLGGEDSYPVAEVLRDRQIPFIILSGYDEIYVRKEFQHYPHLQKPFNSEQLAEVMANTFAKR